MHLQRGREECVINPSRKLEWIPVTLLENNEKKCSDGDFLTWEMQQGRVIRVSTEVS